MPTSPEALQSFLDRQPEPKFEVRGKDPAWLLDVIYRTTGLPFQPKTPWTGSDRDQRQLEGVAFALVVKQVLLYYGMRVGKTKLSLDWLQHLVHVQWIRKALVIPPSPIVVDEWERQIPMHSDLDLSIIRSGPTAPNDLVDALDSTSAGVVVTWSTLQTIFASKRLSRKGTPKLYADRAALREAMAFFQALVVDEIHGCNDWSTLRYDIISELAPEDPQQVPWRLGLTGTPFGRNPFGLWAQGRIVDGGRTLSRSYPFFCEAFGRSIYSHFARNRREVVFDQAKMPPLRAKLEHIVLTCRLEEIQDVEVIASQVELTMLREQAAAYRELIQELIDAQDGDPDAANRTSAIFVRLRQVASGYRVFTDEDGEERSVDFPSAKLAWLDDFASDVDPDLKVVVFHEFVRSGERISDLLTKRKIKHARLWGGTKDRSSVIRSFQEGGVQWLIANFSTGGIGIDLSAADYMCIYESPVSVITRQQMLARPLARQRPLVVDDLICAPVEHRILSFQAEGRSLQELFHQPQKLIREVKLK